MKKCIINFLNKKIEKQKILTEEFNKVNKRRECIRQECNNFGKKLPKDIEIINEKETPEEAELGITIHKISEYMIPEKGKFRKFLKYN